MSPSLVLIDTSVWVLALNKRVNMPPFRERVDQLLKENRAAITPMVSLELLGGTRSTAEFNRLKSRLEALPQLAIGEKEWQEAARLAFELRRQGKTIPYADILIAATAIRSGASLLHADHHFDLIAETTGLAVDSLVSLVRRGGS